MLAAQNYVFDDAAKKAMVEYIAMRRTQPHFANARSIRNALDRARLRAANRLFQAGGPLDAKALVHHLRTRHPRQPRVQGRARCRPKEQVMTFDRSIKIAPSILSADFADFGAKSRPSRRRAPTGCMST